jgi:hypothetical protein
MEFLTTSPISVAGVLLVGVLSVAAMAGPILVRRRWDLERLQTNNEVAGFKFATVGVLYAVLLLRRLIRAVDIQIEVARGRELDRWDAEPG